MADAKETCVEFYGDANSLSGYSSETKYINKMRKLLQEHPNEVKVISDDDYGMMVHVPKKWFKAPNVPRTRVLTEEQKQQAADRLKKMREGKSKNNKFCVLRIEKLNQFEDFYIYWGKLASKKKIDSRLKFSILLS